MNILDENISSDQRRLLLDWRVRVRHIGFDIGRSGMQDEEIIPFVQQLRRCTFFTRDIDYYNRRFCHPNCCFIYMNVDKREVAGFVRRFLHHPKFDTFARRKGLVIRLTNADISIWQVGAAREIHVDWQK